MEIVLILALLKITFIYSPISVCASVCVCVCSSACVCLCACVYMYACVCVYKHQTHCADMEPGEIKVSTIVTPWCRVGSSMLRRQKIISWCGLEIFTLIVGSKSVTKWFNVFSLNLVNTEMLDFSFSTKTFFKLLSSYVPIYLAISDTR